MAAAFKVLPQVEINGKLLEDTLLTSPEKLVEVGVPAKDIKKSSIGNYRLDI